MPKKMPIKNTDDMEKYISINAMQDVAQYSVIALPIIIFFESVMILNWVFRFKHEWSIGSAGYLISYIILIIVSLAYAIFFRIYRKNAEENFRKLWIGQSTYAFLIFLWALTITALDTYTRDNFNVVVYVTIMTIVPVFCYMHPAIWGVLQAVSAAVMISMAFYNGTHVVGFIMNFCVLTLMSIVAQMALYRTKRTTYIRQYELAQAREREYRLAHVDELTGLLNRRSYSERINELEQKGMPENTVIVSLDVNGLKNVNDTLGHAAGDELLAGAADVMREAFSAYGTLYRTGGDEYMAILDCPEVNEESLRRLLNRAMTAWHGTYCSAISISSGYAFRTQHPDWAIIDLERKADQEMYEMKRLHYANCRPQ